LCWLDCSCRSRRLHLGLAAASRRCLVAGAAARSVSEPAAGESAGCHLNKPQMTERPSGTHKGVTTARRHYVDSEAVDPTHPNSYAGGKLPEL
jgi:hypothetical protein